MFSYLLKITAKVLKLYKKKMFTAKQLGWYPREFAAHCAVVLADGLPSGSSSHTSSLQEMCGPRHSARSTLIVSSCMISPPGLKVKNVVLLFTPAAASLPLHERTRWKNGRRERSQCPMFLLHGYSQRRGSSVLWLIISERFEKIRILLNMQYY